MRAIAVANFSDLQQLARLKSRSEYQPVPPLPVSLDGLTYDKYRLIAFRHSQALWFDSKKPFWLEMFHRGFLHRNRADLYVISHGRTHQIPFAPALFEYRGELANLAIPQETGFAGVRIVGTFPGRSDQQEMLTFLGASYFRALFNTGVYGASTRGLAVNIGTNGKEEFPAFRTFWVVDPNEDARELEVLALLDGPSVSGAYQFRFQPHKHRSVIHVRATIYLRKEIPKLGIAPITSMWMWGDGMEAPPLDRRPAVHDSDGLLIKAKDDWTFRALNRQSYPSLSSYSHESVEGFGLLQRETNYARYRDDEAKYHLRPSVWIKPKSPFKNGRIELLELPGVHEGIDNIAAYWVIADPVSVDAPLELDYEVSYFPGNWPEHDWLGTVTETNVEREQDGSIRFVVTFDGKALSNVASETPIEIEASSIRARILKTETKVGPKGSRIAEIVVVPEGNGPVEIQARLKDSNRNLTELWAYLCPLTPPDYKYPNVYTRME